MKAVPPEKNIPPIYTADYYRMEKLIRDESFQNRLKELLGMYAKIGCPVPATGFKEYALYMEWLGAFFDRYEQMERADELLPPIAAEWRDEILAEYGFDTKTGKYATFLDGYIFLGKKSLDEYSFEIRWIRNQETEKFELFIQVYPYTKREHISKLWKEIAKEQKRMPEYIGKSKKWETFDRDLEIYMLYQKLKSDRPARRASELADSLDSLVWGVMKNKYDKLKLGDVRRAVSRVAKLDLKV